ncbi:MAG: hypothetical protein PVI07_17615 [Anaerolineae bacterium]|jgi:hypothetical protein
MTGGQIFVLVFLLGGAISGAIFLMGLGIYYWGRGQYRKGRQDEEKQSRLNKSALHCCRMQRSRKTGSGKLSVSSSPLPDPQLNFRIARSR